MPDRARPDAEPQPRAHPTRLALVPGTTGQPAPTATDARLDAILHAWPDGATPPRAIERADAHRPGGLILALALDDDDDAALDRLMSTLGEAWTLLSLTPDHRAPSHPPVGRVTLPISTPPAAVAAAACVLLQQQPTLARLASEVNAFQHSASGIEHRLLAVHDEMQIAASLQREFIPHADALEIPGVDVGVLYRPAGYVSGDVYDLARLDEDTYAFFLADAAGHGVPAALMTLVLLHALPRYDPSSEELRPLPPADALALLNNALFHRTQRGRRFATGIYGHFRPSTGELTLSVAGHPAPLLRSPDGTVSRPDAGGPLLGVFPHARFEEHRTVLEPGASLTLFTDGLETAYGGPSARGGAYVAHLEQLARRLGEGGPADEALERFEHDLASQAGSLNPDDDVTVLVLRRRARDTAGRRTDPAARRAA